MKNLNNKELLKYHCEDMLARNMSIEKILNYLRQNNCSKTKSMAILAETKNINLAEAKELVHFSQTWQDLRDRDEKLHDNLEKILEQIMVLETEVIQLR